MNMYAGGPGGDPYMGGLLGTASNYSYPLTGGLLGSMTPQQSSMGPWSQTAYNMAGRPQQGGGYASVPVPSGTGISGGGTGSSGGGSSGTSVVGGLLGAIAQNPTLAKTVGSYLGKGVGGLLGSGTTDAIGSMAAGSTLPAAGSALGVGSVPLTSGGTTVLGSVASPGIAADLGAETASAGAAGAADAGGLLAPVGTDAIGAAGDAGAAEAASALGSSGADAAAAGGADAAAGSSAGMGAAAGAASAVGLAALPFILSRVVPEGVTQKYWDTMASNLQGGKSNPNFYGAAIQALNASANQVPDNIKQAVWASGFVPQGQWGMTPGGSSAQLMSILQGNGGLAGGSHPAMRL